MNEIEIKWDLLGAKLASLSDHEQSLFFEGFGRELKTWDTSYSRHMQMCSVGNKLSSPVKDVLKECLPCIYLNDNELDNRGY